VPTGEFGFMRLARRTICGPLRSSEEADMIDGAHIIIHSKNADADRDLLRDVLAFPYVDAGHDWLIFRLPQAEAAVHPSDENDKHELYLMCDDVERTVRELSAKGASCEPVSTQRWGRTTRIRLPGGGALGLYEPRRARP
jgi:hypothetical protein